MDKTAARRAAVLSKLVGWGGWWANADDRWDENDMNAAVEAIMDAYDFISKEDDAIARVLKDHHCSCCIDQKGETE